MGEGDGGCGIPRNDNRKNQFGMEISEDCGRKYYQPSRKREKGRKFFGVRGFSVVVCMES